MPYVLYTDKPPMSWLLTEWPYQPKDWRPGKVLTIKTIKGHTLQLRSEQVLAVMEATQEELDEQQAKRKEAEEAATNRPGNRVVRMPGLTIPRGGS